MFKSLNFINSFYCLRLSRKVQHSNKLAAHARQSAVSQWELIYLARSANLPTGLCILPSIISSFFTMSKTISVSTGPIFTIFTPNGRYLREFS